MKLPIQSKQRKEGKLPYWDRKPIDSAEHMTIMIGSETKVAR